MYNLSDTICAICTPPGVGSIAAIRISGKDSWDIVNKIFVNAKCHSEPKAKNLITLKDSSVTSFLQNDILLSHMQAQHGYIKEGDKTIDEVIVLPYKAPNSFTAEDVIEIFTHGGNQVTSMVIDLCLKNGARLAKNGEFSFRAFINGRIDLTEAEAINDLISATSSLSVLSANQMLKGGLAEKVKNFREKLLNLLTVIESSIEFPSDVGDLDSKNFSKQLIEIISEINSLIETSKEGQILRDGFKISIIGAPNAGKSSLLNRLLENERAIVTNTPGTTRDTIEEKISLNGYPIVLVDTAGIRHEEKLEEAEKFGIERSKQAIERSNLIIYVYDVTNKKDDFSQEVLNSINGKTKLVIGNKIDLRHSEELCDGGSDILISAKDGTNIDKLKSLIVNKIKEVTIPRTKATTPSQFFINQRQKELLIQCSSSISFAKEILDKKDPEDLVADELKKAISKLDEVSGQNVSEEVINNIFSKFCIGK